MLYIGGYDKKTKLYSVVDTDDGTSQSANRHEIRSYVQDYGIDIKGVSTVEVSGKVYVTSIDIFRGESIRTPKAERIFALYGVDIRVEGDTLVTIEIPKERIKPLRIRLSDFASVCGEHVIKRADVNSLDVPDVELVVDDRIDISDRSLSRIKRHGVRINLMEYTGDRLVNCIVREFSMKIDVFSDIDRYIVDRVDRIDYYKAKALIEQGMNMCVSSINDYVSDPVKVNSTIAREYYHEFRALLLAKFRVSNSDRFIMDCDSLAKWLQTSGVASLLAKRDFKAIKASRCIEILNVSRYTLPSSGTEFISVEKLDRYIHMFDVSEDIQEIFIDFCIKWRDWLRKWSLQRGWLHFWS